MLGLSSWHLRRHEIFFQGIPIQKWCQIWSYTSHSYTKWCQIWSNMVIYILSYIRCILSNYPTKKDPQNKDIDIIRRLGSKGRGQKTHTKTNTQQYVRRYKRPIQKPRHSNALDNTCTKRRNARQMQSRTSEPSRTIQSQT